MCQSHPFRVPCSLHQPFVHIAWGLRRYKMTYRICWGTRTTRSAYIACLVCNNPVLSSVFRPSVYTPLKTDPHLLSMLIHRIYLHGEEHPRVVGVHKFKACRTSYMYLNLNCAIFSSFTADKTHSISIWAEAPAQHSTHTCPHLCVHVHTHTGPMGTRASC